MKMKLRNYIKLKLIPIHNFDSFTGIIYDTSP